MDTMTDDGVRSAIARVALRVSDVGRSVEFYERVAGLRIRAGGDEQAALGAPEGGPILLELGRAARPGRAPRRAAGLFHTAFRFPTRAALTAALRRLIETRQPLTGASDHGVSEALYLDDPDGLGVELYRDRPRDRWPSPQPGQRVHMPTLPLDLDDLLATAEDHTPAARSGVDIGHVHLKVADVDEAVGFWTRAIGMEVKMRIGSEAAFLAHGDYHHHIGANTWYSRGAAIEPSEGPGLESVVIAVPGALESRTPDGVPVRLEAVDRA